VQCHVLALGTGTLEWLSRYITYHLSAIVGVLAMGSMGLVSRLFRFRVHSPGIAVHLHRRFRPLPDKHTRPSRRLLAKPHRSPIIPIQLFWNLIFSRTSEPTVSQKGMGSSNEQLGLGLGLELELRLGLGLELELRLGLG